LVLTVNSEIMCYQRRYKLRRKWEGS